MFATISDVTAALGELFVSVVPKLGEAASGAMEEGGAAAGNTFAGAFGGAATSAIGEHLKKTNEQFRGFGAGAASTFMSTFSDTLSGQMPNVMRVFDQFEDTVSHMLETAGSLTGIGVIFSGLLLSVRPFFDTFKQMGGEFTEQLLDIGERYQEVARRIAATTLDTGQIEGLTAAVRDLMASGTVVSLRDVSEAIGRLNTNVHGLSIDQLKELTRTFAEAEELVGHFSATQFAGIFERLGNQRPRRK